MAIAAFQVMNENGVTSLYVDTDNNRLITIQETHIQSRPMVNHLTVDDFVQFTGSVISREQTSWFQNDLSLSKLSNIIYHDQAGWQRANHFLNAIQAKYPADSLSFPDSNSSASTVHPDLSMMKK